MHMIIHLPVTIASLIPDLHMGLISHLTRKLA
jgi:hypothetical protein